MNHEIAFLKALEGDTTHLAEISASSGFAKRFDIYETSIVGTRQKTLLKIFKPLEQLIGAEAFNELCYRYAKRHVSHEVNLNRYGEGLSQLAKDAPFSKDLPYLADFVEFCYIWQQVYLQGGEPILLESDYPVYAIWERCQPEFKGDQHIENWQGPFQYVLYREQDKVRVMTEPAIALHNQQDQADGV